MTAAIVLRWMMANLVSVYKVSLILCAALGSGIGFCRALQLLCRDHKTKGVEAMRRMRLAVPGKVQPR